MKTPIADQLALFKTVQTHSATAEEYQCLAGLTFFSVSLYHLNNITFLGAFATEEEAENFADFEHRINGSHPDFTRGGEGCARWVVSQHVFDEAGIEQSWAICGLEADEV